MLEAYVRPGNFQPLGKQHMVAVMTTYSYGLRLRLIVTAYGYGLWLRLMATAYGYGLWIRLMVTT